MSRRVAMNHVSLQRLTKDVGSESQRLLGFVS